MRCFTKALFLCLLVGSSASLAAAHGGVYVGPGTSLPPGGRPPSKPPVPVPGSPTNPGMGGGKGGPATSVPPAAPTIPGAGPATGGGMSQDLSAWQNWWWLNRAPYLNLKAALDRQVVVTGSDASFRAGSSQEGSARRSEVRRLRARMIGVLSAALPESHAPDLTTAILLALGKTGSCLNEADIPAVQETIRPLLQDANQEVAETAAIALGALAHPAPALLLSEILEDSPAGRAAVGRPEVPYRTRAFAAYGLGLIGARVPSQDVRRFVVRQLARTLEADRTASSDLGVACLEALGIVRLELAAQTDAKHPASSSASVSGDAEAVYLMQFFAKQRRPDLLRAYVPVSLARSLNAGAPDLVEDAVTALCSVVEPHSKEPALVQQSVAMALPLLPVTSEAQQKRIYAALQETAAHGERWASNLALISLARVSAANTVRGTGLETGAQVRALLIRETTRGPAMTRPWAALALGIFERTLMAAGSDGSSDARSAVRGALVDRRGPSEIGAYCVAAGLMRDTTARDVLVHILFDGPDDDVRAHAAIGLGLMQDDAALEPLRKVLPDSRYRPVLLRDTAIALGLLGDTHAASQLSTMLAEAKSLGAQSAIASGLGFIGDARSIEPLLGLIESKTSGDRTKAFAAAALGNICDESLLPWNTAYALDASYALAPPSLYDPLGAAGLLDLL